MGYSVNHSAAARYAREKAAELEQRVENAIANTADSAEIIDARGGETVLKNRLDNFDQQIGDLQSDLGTTNDKVEEITQFTDTDTNKKYRYTLKQQDGHVVFTYEEVL